MTYYGDVLKASELKARMTVLVYAAELAKASKKVPVSGEDYTRVYKTEHGTIIASAQIDQRFGETDFFYELYDANHGDVISPYDLCEITSVNAKELTITKLEDKLVHFTFAISELDKVEFTKIEFDD